MWVVMVQHKIADQHLTSGKGSTRSIHGFKRYRLLKPLTRNFNILSNADADADTDADADVDAVVTAIAPPVLTYRRAKRVKGHVFYKIYTIICIFLEPFPSHLPLNISYCCLYKLGCLGRESG